MGKVDYKVKTQQLSDGIVKNLKFLGADGQILTAGKSGKIPPGQAAGYYKGAIVFADGKSKAGFVETTLSDYVLFKTSEKPEVEKIESSLLKSVSASRFRVTFILNLKQNFL